MTLHDWFDLGAFFAKLGAIIVLGILGAIAVGMILAAAGADQ